jgi:hypothetical protein
VKLLVEQSWSLWKHLSGEGGSLPPRKRGSVLAAWSLAFGGERLGKAAASAYWFVQCRGGHKKHLEVSGSSLLRWLFVLFFFLALLLIWVLFLREKLALVYMWYVG